MSVTEQTNLAFSARRIASMGDKQVYFRVYIAPGGLFFIRAADSANASTAYLMGGVIGMLVASWMNQQSEKKTPEIIARLDRLSLRDRLDDSPSNFRLPFAEIEKISFNPRSGWNATGKHCARMVLRQSGKRSKSIFEIVSPDDMNVALAELGKALSDRVEINVEWNKDKKKYVKKKKQKQKQA